MKALTIEEGFGNATTDKVLKGNTFSSEEVGFNIEGTLVPNYSELPDKPSIGTVELKSGINTVDSLGLLPKDNPDMTGRPTINSNMTYHTGNIIVSNVKPTEAMPEGYIYQVY